MNTRIDFLYLSEPDTIAAGVNDAARCVDTCAEVFGLLAKGDYLMGGSNHNSHGMGILFPKETPFPNMPVAGPDRRFFAMPAYLGGRFDVCGNKWYGSNAANTAKGLPRSILTLVLNDKDTYVFVACGMAVFDVAWGYDIYQNALREGIGQKLNLWETPSL